MTFEEWSNKKKKEQEQSGSGSTSTKPSFSEWSNNKKASAVDQDFINSFLSDANSFLGSAEKDYGKVAWGNASSLYESKLTTRNDLDSRAASIRAWASQNMEKLGRDAYTTITSMLNNYTNGSKSIMDSFKSANDYYTQFESEAQYNDSVKLNELYSMTADELKPHIDRGENIAYTTSGGQNVTWQQLYDEKKKKEEFDALYAGLSSSGDWDEYVQKGANIENPTFDEAQGFFHIGGWHWGEKDVGNIVTFSLANKDQVRLGDMASSNPDSTVGNLYYTYMTDEEVNIYNYYLAKHGNEKAETYLDSLQGQLEDRHNNQLLVAMADLAAEHPVSASVLSVWQNTFSGVEYLKDIAKYATTGELDENTLSKSASTIRGTISANTDWMIGNWDAFDFVYNTTMSLADSMTAMATFGVGGGVSLGLSAAAQGTNDALARGMSNGQAFMNGFASGIFEGLFESVSIGKFNALKETATTSGKQLAKNIGKQMLVNASEETLTELANIAYDFVANGDFSQWETSIRQYMQSGMSESDAKMKVALELGAQVAESAASGAFMGLGTGTAGSAINNYRGAKASKAAYGSGSSLVNETLERASEGSEARAFAEAYKAALDGGKNLSGGKLYKLSNAYETDLRTQDTTKIKAAVAERLTELGEDGDIEQISSVIAKQVAGKKLTADEKSLLKSSYAGERVVSEMNPENIASGEYTSGWAEKIGTDRINAGAYNKALHDLAMEQAGATVGEEESSATVDSTPTKEIAPEAKFSTSDDGKTVLIDTNEEVEIQGIASIENGKVKLRTNKGEVDAEKISFGTDNEALLYEAVTDMTAEAARNMIDAYDPSAGVSTSDYIHGFKDSYKYGYFGFAESELAKGVFTKDLSEAQRHIAYTVGKNAGEAVVKEAQKSRTEAKEKGDKSAPKKGKIFINGKEYKLGEKTGLGGIRDASVKGTAVLAESVGAKVYFFESYLNKEGRRVYRDENGNVVHAPHGKYDPKTGYIYIDLNAGKMGEGLVMYTVAHEMTHFIRDWSPAKFKIFADFLLENYAKKGVSVEALVQAQIEKAAKNGREISFDEAYEEVIADSCQAMLEDGSAIKKIAELKAKDQSLWQKIKKFLSDIVAKIKKAYAGLDPYSSEGRFVKNQLDTFEQLQSMWIDALVDAGETYSAMGDIVQADADGQSVAPMLSERTWTESEYVHAREATAKQIVKDLGVSLDTAYKYIDDINSVARLISDDRARLDYEPNLDSKATVIKPNSDYKWSVDMSTLCAKRLLFTGTFDAIQRALPNTAFDSDDIVRIRGMMEERGYEVACGICYVESTRREIGTITADFIERYKEAQKTGKPITRINSEGKAVELRKTKDQMETTADTSTKQFFAEKGYTPTLAELNTTDIDLVKRGHPLVYEAYLNYMNARGQAKPKLLETRAEYKGEILKHFKYKSAVTSRNNAGGLRLQSFSDFEVPHLIDMMQITMDMARVGLKSQAYTKVPSFAEAFGNTGIKINLSLIAKGTGVDADGNLIFDDKEGINHTEAFRLRDKFSKNVGTILVGKNDAHIIAAMADPRIDYIIPFHKSSWKESLYDALGLTGYADYTDTQHEKPIDSTRTIKDFDPSEYWDFSKTGDENAQIYLEKCREDGRIPKFPQFQGYEGYWKLLIDFKMYDNDGVGSPQEVVRPIFDNAVNERILSEYEGGHQSFPVAKDVVKDFVKEKKQGVKLSDRDIRYSDRVTDQETLDFLENQEHVTVYRAMQLIDGKLYPPMNAYTYDENGKKVLMPPSEIGAWEQSVERPDLIDPKTGKFKLDKGKVDTGKRGTAVPAAYNPYIHTSLSMLNDQFTSAYQRSNLVVVKGVVPKSELTSGYRAQYAKDTVGETEWHSGVVSTQLPESRKVILSRWFKPVEIMSDDAVAQGIKEMLGDTGIEIPYNVVSPKLRRSLENLGVPIGEGRGIRNLPAKSEVKYDDRDHFVEDKYFRTQMAKWEDLKHGAYVNVGQIGKNHPLHAVGMPSGVLRYDVDKLKRNMADHGDYLSVELLRAIPDIIADPVAISEFSEENTVSVFGDVFVGNSPMMVGVTISKDRAGNDISKVRTFNARRDVGNLITDDTVLYLGEDKKRTRKWFQACGIQVPLGETRFGFIRSISQKSDSVKRKFSDREVEDITTNDYVKMYNHFGSTKNYDVAGYMLGNGIMLDFSGKHWGNPYPTSRDVDHRDIQEVLDDRGHNGVNAMIDMIGNGNIRLMPEVGGINLAVKPNATQMSQLRGYINHFKGEIVVDIDKVGGDTIHSFTYHKGTSSSKILSDIKAYFDEGTVPEQKVKDETDIRQFLYSDRSDSDISNRELLANSLESAAANDIERNKLALYKQKIALINAEEKKLHELKAKIGELSFAKGKKDVEQIKKLQFEAKQTENRINTYDRQLLNLEASAPLKAVLDREKKMAYKKAEQKGKDALAAYREKAAADKRKLLERASESRKRGIEGRRMTEMRHRIKSITSELNDLLLKPTNKKHIKEELRKSVADALSAINMDTVGAEERVAHYNDLIARAKDPDVIEALTQSRDRIQLQGDNLQGKLTALQNAYEKIKNSEDIQLNLAYQEVILNSIKAVSEKVGNTAIRNMSLEQLEMVYDLYSMIRKTIRDANKLFKQAKFESIMQTAEAVNEEVRKVGGSRYKIPVISATAQKLWWSLLKPLVAFRTIGSDTLTGLYKNLRAGEDTFFGDVSEAQAFIEEQYKKHGFKSWDMKATKQFTAKSGKTFDLTLEQMMSLYAYSRREQAHAHIMEGGIVFEDSVIVEKNKLGIPIKYEVTTKDAFNLSEETLIDIVNSLTAEQKAFVNEMQAYLSSTMGAKGNEVSMEMLGVKLFKEEFYLPIKSSQYYLNFSNEEAGEIKLKNPAFSKETVTHANNPIVLHNFTDLWAEHINNMSMYHSFVLALEDFTRVYNYKTKTDASVETMDTKATIESAYAGATKYISNFLKSLNGGVRMETVGMAEKLTSLAKKGSVLGSWSVAIQQPSAIMRAMASINPKYFVAPPKSLNLVKHKQDWEELKKYAPIAGIKEMGRFDVGMGQDTVDWIKSNKTAMNKVEDALSIPPALMDEVTWLSIWNAVKRETLHNNPKLSPTSEQFLKLAGERFTDIVSLTQVYDSVFSRSQMMRNKSWIAKALTAFMAEPTTTLNMLYDAHIQGKRTGVKGYLKTASSTGGAVVASIVLNAALKSIIMAMRDDDEDESYAESYMEHFFGDLKDNMNPLTLIPIAKDIVSIFKGYDVERMDMALISDLKNAIDAFGSDSKTNYEKWSGLVGAISAFFGVPVKNVERDIRGLLNTMFGDSEDTTSAGLLNAIEEGWTGKEKSNGQQLYEAMLNGDDEQIERVKGRFKDQTAIDNAIRKALRENDPRVKEAAQAIIDEDYSKYTDLANEIIGEGYFSETNVVKAIKSEVDAMTDDEDKSDTADKDVSLYEMEHFFSAVVGDDFVMAQAIKEDIIRTKIANGDERDEAEESFNSSFTNKCGKEYKKGNVSYSEAVSMLVSYGGKTEEKATSKVQYWDFQMDYPEYDDLSESAVGAYYEHAAPVGIGVSTYYSYYKSKSKCKGTDSNGDGRADSGTVKAEILAVINSLPLTSAQKDALYFAEGWATSTLWEAPWR